MWEAYLYLGQGLALLLLEAVLLVQILLPAGFDRATEKALRAQGIDKIPGSTTNSKNVKYEDAGRLLGCTFPEY